MNPNYRPRLHSICTPTPAHLLSPGMHQPGIKRSETLLFHILLSRAKFVSFKLGYLVADNERFLFQWIFLATGNLESRFKTKHKMLRMFKAVFLIIVYYVPVCHDQDNASVV